MGFRALTLYIMLIGYALQLEIAAVTRSCSQKHHRGNAEQLDTAIQSRQTAAVPWNRTNQWEAD